MNGDITTSFFGKKRFLAKFGNHMYLSAKEKNIQVMYSMISREREADNTFCLVYVIHLTKDAREKGIGTKL